MYFIEREIKLKMTKKQFNDLISSFIILDQKTQKNFYFDSISSSLMQRKASLRIREKDKLLRLQYKTPRDSDSNKYSIRKEYIYGDLLNSVPNYITSKTFVNLFHEIKTIDPGFDENDKYLLQGSLRTVRYTVDILGYKCQCDKNDYLGKDDYEFELEGGNNDLKKMKEFLKKFGINEISTNGKYERFKVELENRKK